MRDYVVAVVMFFAHTDRRDDPFGFHVVEAPAYDMKEATESAYVQMTARYDEAAVRTRALVVFIGPDSPSTRELAIHAGQHFMARRRNIQLFDTPLTVA